MADFVVADKNDIITLADGDRLIVIDASDTDTLKTCTPIEIAAFVFKTGGTLSAKLTAGTIEIEGSNFDINGGTSDGLVINSGSIGSTTPITKLNVDNIQVDGNTISSTAGTDLNIVPLAGQQVIIDGAVTIDSGVVTGISSLTSTDGIISVNATHTGDVGVAGNVYLNCSPQALSGTATVLAAVSRTSLRTGAGDGTVTMADGVEDGQMHYLYFATDGGGDSIISGGKLAFTSITHDTVGQGSTLMWADDDQLWYCVGTSGTLA